MSELISGSELAYVRMPTRLRQEANSPTPNGQLAYVGELTIRRRRVGVGEFARRRVDRIPVRNANKLSAFRTDPVCFSFRSLFELAEVIFSSKSLKKSSIKMFPFNFQLSDDFCEVFGRKSRIGFSVAMSNGRFLCLFKHLSEVLITKSNLLWFS